MGPPEINTEDCIKQTQSQVIVGSNTAKSQWGKIQPKNAWVELSDWLSAGGAVPVQRVFWFLNWGGLPSLGLWVPNLWASWPGQFRGLLWRGAWIHIVECSSEWATFCWNCNNRLGGPHSRDSWEIILKHQRLINKLNSTGTFRRELQASFFETPFQEILPKIIQKQGFLCSFWSYL